MHDNRPLRVLAPQIFTRARDSPTTVVLWSEIVNLQGVFALQQSSFDRVLDGRRLEQWTMTEVRTAILIHSATDASDSLHASVMTGWFLRRCNSCSRCGFVLRYNTIEEFNVMDSKAECDQLNLAHVARTKYI